MPKEGRTTGYRALMDTAVELAECPGHNGFAEQLKTNYNAAIREQLCNFTWTWIDLMAPSFCHFFSFKIAWFQAGPICFLNSAKVASAFSLKGGYFFGCVCPWWGPTFSHQLLRCESFDFGGPIPEFVRKKAEPIGDCEQILFGPQR